MEQEYILKVKPLDNFVLQVDYYSGSCLFLNLSGRIESHRFQMLKEPAVWNSATTNGIFVRFGDVEISHEEILAMAEENETYKSFLLD